MDREGHPRVNVYFSSSVQRRENWRDDSREEDEREEGVNTAEDESIEQKQNREGGFIVRKLYNLNVKPWEKAPGKWTIRILRSRTSFCALEKTQMGRI